MKNEKKDERLLLLWTPLLWYVVLGVPYFDVALALSQILTHLPTMPVPTTRYQHRGSPLQLLLLILNRQDCPLIL